MSNRYVRVFQKLDVTAIQDQLLIYGDLSAICGKCNEPDISLRAHKCKNCETEFKYIAFRNVNNHLPKLKSLSEERPALVFIDYDDFKRNLNEIKAKNFFK